MMAYNWKIIYAKHLNQDVTPIFIPYTFDFQGNNVVTATKADSTFTGSWVRSNTSQSQPKVLMNFGTHYELSMLNYDWQQEERTDNIIKFVDEMSAQSTEAVTFEKIP